MTDRWLMTPEDIYELALRRIMATNGAGETRCETSTAGIGSCFRDGRFTVGGDGASTACPSCIAHQALTAVTGLRIRP